MMNAIDNFLNKITMYRLVLYFLIGSIAWSAALSIFHLMPFSAMDVIFSTAFILAICLVINKIFSVVFEAPVNFESAYITALILALIISPPTSIFDGNYFALAIWASVWAIASKFILAINKKHVFNPAAFGVALTSLTIGLSASWWVGTSYLLPVSLVFGFLIVRKIQRWDLVLSFAAVALFMILSKHFDGSFLKYFWNTIALTPIIFFATVMLTEPLTTPPKRLTRIIYGVLTGLMYSPYLHIGDFYSTPEIALLLGNIFSYLISPKAKLVLKLKEKIEVGRDTFDFIFHPGPTLAFEPGQYLEWTLGHKDPDSRGNRRYFTIASSPTEKNIRLGVKFNNPPSTFKKQLLDLKSGEQIVASQLAGDFVLPGDKSKKLVLVAGGIGVTPFRSMIQYLNDKKEKRDIIIFYSNRNIDEITYTDVFDEAENMLGIKTIYILTGDKIPSDWTGERGRVNSEMIKKHIPDFNERYFYVSGPRTMVVGFEENLKKLGVKRTKIRTDFFPGFA